MMGEEVRFDSYRDPCGYVFRMDGHVYRAIRHEYREQYEHLTSTGLARQLSIDRLLIVHRDACRFPTLPPDVFRVIQPEEVPFISYPWEWSFDQLRDAALLTLRVQRIAMESGMTLKDASALNVQFMHGRPIFIDTLSFDFYAEGRPWVAYRQFCEHFLAPLALASYVDSSLLATTQFHGGGIPLPVACRVLGARGCANPGLVIHLRLQMFVQHAVAHMTTHRLDEHGSMRKESLLGLLTSLEHTIAKLPAPVSRSRWTSYYPECRFGEEYLSHKKAVVAGFLGVLRPRWVWDIGANSGPFSRLAAQREAQVVAFDDDSASIGTLYRDALGRGEERILPLVMDIANPSPSSGWANREFRSIFDRGRPDICLALAIVHHLAIARNLPFGHIADLFARYTPWLAIEFVPKEDSNVQLMLRNRTDVFEEYRQDRFEEAFRARFETIRRVSLHGSERTLYLLKRRRA